MPKWIIAFSVPTTSWIDWDEAPPKIKNVSFWFPMEPKDSQKTTPKDPTSTDSEPAALDLGPAFNAAEAHSSYIAHSLRVNALR